MNAHKVSDKLISNAEFLKFVLDGGYEREEFWSKDGWNWASGSLSKFPKFWVNRSEGQTALAKSSFTLRLTYSETESMPWDMPVEVNCYEATAYTRWLTKKTGNSAVYRLPTEDEYYAMLKHTGFDYKAEKHNIALRYTSPTPVDKYNHKGIFDPMGNVW